MVGDIPLSRLPDRSGDETDSVLSARALYSAQALEAAFRLAGLIRLDETATEQFLDGIAERVDAMGGDRRRDTAETIDELAGLLGMTACREEATATEANEALEPYEEPAKRESIGYPLNRQQRAWLGRFLDDDDIVKVEFRDLEQRIALGGTLGRQYESIRSGGQIPNLGWQPEEQLKAFMGGESYAKIAHAEGAYPGNVARRFRSVADAIRKHVSYDEIMALINHSF